MHLHSANLLELHTLRPALPDLPDGTFLPGGLRYQYGTVDPGGSSTGRIDFPIAYATVYIVTITYVSSSLRTWQISSYDDTGFTFLRDSKRIRTIIYLVSHRHIMSKKLILGPFDKGLRKDVLPFVIDNNSFPTLINAYQWRGRVKRKRGTQLLTRMQRFFNSSSVSYSPTSTITLDGSGVGNILTAFSLQTNGSIIPGTVTLVGSLDTVTYTDPTMDGYLTPTGTGGANTILYKNGQIIIPAQAGQTITAIFRYYPDLPSMGFRDLNISTLSIRGNISFDTTYSYNVLSTFPYLNYDVSFYKNPPSSGTYVIKTNTTPVKWNGQNYQQFWTT